MTKIVLEIKNKKNKLKIGYLSSVSNCTFGFSNTICNNCEFNNVDLGDFSYVSKNAKIFNTKIGKFCSIASNVICGLGKHPTDFVSTHPIFFSNSKQAQISFADKIYFEESKEITIGNDVWVGYGAIILDGVKIGNGAIIGAGAVVTTNVPPYAIVGGIPAKIIRYRFDKQKIDILLKIKWWDKDREWLKDNFKLFHNPDLLIQKVILDM